jgi:hypothetical protein
VIRKDQIGLFEEEGKGTKLRELENPLKDQSLISSKALGNI